MRRLLPLCSLLLALLVACDHSGERATTPAPAPVPLVILHTNDTHGAVWGSDEVGSAAQRASVVDEVRREVAAAGGVTLLLDAGDVHTGTFCSDRQGAEPDLEAMEAMGYDAMVVGNHEFDRPFRQTLAQRELVDFPILGANVVRSADGQALFQPTAVIERGGLRVGVLGVVTAEAVTTSTRGSDPALGFEDPIATARRLVPELRRQVDLMVVLSHLGLEADRRLAAEVEGIDVIVGGHSHDALTEPLVVGDTVIVQAGHDGSHLGRLDLVVGVDGVELRGGRLVPVTADLPADPEVAGVLSRYACAETNEVVTRLDGPIAHDPLDGLGTSTALSNLISDAYREIAGTDLSIMNKGGIRADLPAGEVTPAHIHAVLPFGNELVVLEVEDDDLLAIARSVRDRGRDGRGILFTSGMTFQFGPGDQVEVMIDGSPPEPGRRYTLAISSFMAHGGDGHDPLARLEPLRGTGQTTAEVLTTYLRAHPDPPIDRESRTRWIDAE